MSRKTYARLIFEGPHSCIAQILDIHRHSTSLVQDEVSYQ